MQLKSVMTTKMASAQQKSLGQMFCGRPAVAASHKETSTELEAACSSSSAQRKSHNKKVHAAYSEQTTMYRNVPEHVAKLKLHHAV